MNEKEIFAKNLRLYVERSGKNQGEIAKELGVSKGTFSDWMRSRCYPRMDKVELLARYFGISKSDLVEEKSFKNEHFVNKKIKEIDDFLIQNPAQIKTFENFLKLSVADRQSIIHIIERLIEDEKSGSIRKGFNR